MSWSSQRRATYLFIIALIFLLPTAIVLFLVNYRPATCTDGIQNQDEQGVDCGGVCTLVCRDAVADPLIAWYRLLPVSEGRYTLASSVENPNPNAAAENVKYVFKVYDEEGVIIHQREGAIDLEPKSLTAVVEPSVDVGGRIPARTTFELIKDTIVWERRDARDIPVVVRDTAAADVDTMPRVEATLYNVAVRPLGRFEVDVIVYGNSGNAIAASRTFVDGIGKDSSQKAVFTWPQAFTEQVSRIDIVPKVWLE